ncbi:hypothetical protein [Anaeromyxobacter sp. PSR-1]|uniref:hypothetical protein n=1 Tax=Anaeromyxobacter sp. PSR-1 TaxID=1300915 RepID=UPI00126A3DCE|nr:hypothetical protein [Anaeromyxobacter sp. PSR-1]
MKSDAEMAQVVAEVNAMLPRVVSAESLIPEFDPNDPTTRTGGVTLTARTLPGSEPFRVSFSGVSHATLPSEGDFELRAITLHPHTEFAFHFHLTTAQHGAFLVRAYDATFRRSRGIMFSP